MEPLTLGAFINIEGSSHIAGPPAALIHNSPHNRQKETSPSGYKFDQLSVESRFNRPTTGLPRSSGASVISLLPMATKTPGAPDRADMQTPLAPSHDAVDAVQSLKIPPMNRWRYIAACSMCFANGLNDSAPGALLPYMETDYNIGYAIVSLIFVANALGFIIAAPSGDALQARLGRAKMLALAEALMAIGYIALVCTPPFPVVLIAFFVLGLGLAWNLALNNVFCANLINSTTMLGVFHGSYGVGGTIGPLIATALVSHGYRWSRVYFLALGISIVNCLAAYWTFRNYELDVPSLPHSAPDQEVALQNLHPATTKPESKPAMLTLKQAVRNKTTIFGALFIFAYQGAEVSISGWVISFLLTYRSSTSSQSSIGYVTAGFWAGITLGRFLLSRPCHKLGEKNSVTILTIGAAGFQLLVWFVPNIIGEAVAVSIVGLLLGPVYPCATAVFTKLLNRRIQMSSLAFICALGSTGGALAPFMTGLIAQKAGTWVLHPICIGLFGMMVGSWAGLDRIGKRKE